MKFKNSFKIYALLFLVSLFFSCNKSDSGNAADTLIPDLSAAAWRNTNDIQHDDLYFFFNVSNPGTGSSTFDGNESIDGDTHALSGSYQNSKITFTFNDGPKQGTTYTGKINDNTTMTLTTPAGTITLRKQ